MPVIPFSPNIGDQIADFMNSLPDFGTLDAEGLLAWRSQTEEWIHRLDESEPRNEESEEYDLWAEMHEDLEDVLDEILDCQEALGE